MPSGLLWAGWVEGRLRPGASLADAQAELDVLAARLRADDPQADRRDGVSVTSGRAYAPPFDAGTWAVIAMTMAARRPPKFSNDR